MAAGVNITVTLNEAAIRALSLRGGMVDQAVQRASGRVRDRAKNIVRGAGRVDTGALVQSITSEPEGPATYRVGTSLEYAVYQHEGPRAHGPRRARMLRFVPKGGSQVVYARHVRGVTALPFLRQAAEQTSVVDFT